MDKSMSTVQNVLLINGEQKQLSLVFKAYFMPRGNVNQGQKFLCGSSVFGQGNSTAENGMLLWQKCVKEAPPMDTNSSSHHITESQYGLRGKGP